MRAPQQGRALRPVGLARGRGHAGEHGGHGTRCCVLIVAFEIDKSEGRSKAMMVGIHGFSQFCFCVFSLDQIFLKTQGEWG